LVYEREVISMQIKTPKRRAYYPASRNERDRLLCWIPAEELERMVQDGRVVEDILEDYPDGLEIEVSEEAFEEFGIDIDVSPEAIRHAFADLTIQKRLPQSGIVDGASLERIAQQAQGSAMESFTLRPPAQVHRFSVEQELPEPEMTDGEDPMTVLTNLQ
jgi:hypothetical protein